MELADKAVAYKRSLEEFSEEYRNRILLPQGRLVSFVINALKYPKDKIVSEIISAGFDIKETSLPFAYTSDSRDFKISPAIRNMFDEGKIYFIGLSSLLPTLSLKPHGMVLDMCAAPGGKTFYSQLITGNSLKITCVDNNKNRVEKLTSNLKNLGVENFDVIYSDVSKLTVYRPDLLGKFDCIILDAPCSNESKLDLNNLSSFEYWNTKISSRLSKLQKKMLAESSKLLKPHGQIVYSTCTYSPKENEDVVCWALKKNLGLTIVDIEIDPKKVSFADQVSSKVTAGFSKRIMPNNGFGGFFLAKFVAN